MYRLRCLNFEFPACSKLWIWCRQKHLKGHWLSQDCARCQRWWLVKFWWLLVMEVALTPRSPWDHFESVMIAKTSWPKQIIHNSCIPHEIKHASHAYRYLRITFPSVWFSVKALKSSCHIIIIIIIIIKPILIPVYPCIRGVAGFTPAAISLTPNLHLAWFIVSFFTKPTLVTKQ